MTFSRSYRFSSGLESHNPSQIEYTTSCVPMSQYINFKAIGNNPRQLNYKQHDKQLWISIHNDVKKPTQLHIHLHMIRTSQPINHITYNSTTNNNYRKLLLVNTHPSASKLVNTHSLRCDYIVKCTRRPCPLTASYQKIKKTTLMGNEVHCTVRSNGPSG